MPLFLVQQIAGAVKPLFFFMCVPLAFRGILWYNKMYHTLKNHGPNKKE